MCNAYTVTTNADAIIALVKAWRPARRKSNQDILPGIFPNYRAPILRLEGDDLVLDDALWGMPTPAEHLVTATGKPKSYDRGITNIRKTYVDHWRPWLGIEYRCLVPFTTFSELDITHKNHYFKFVDGREVGLMAGIFDTHSRQIRAKDEAPTAGQFYAFLTTTPNAEVAPIHAKAMPVILTQPEDWDAWLTADWSIAKAFQRALPDGLLKATPSGASSEVVPT